MERHELLKICSEFMNVLNTKDISPKDAETAAAMFERMVRKNNEKAKREWERNGKFAGSLPKK